ncbi:hypothetical protein POM88_020000 [Heracleum sosnowskyi]|uniref:Uncharacterized protein n=1 Tax=Heracleum sosnowskyi TaxID=360622 RepID=A0AAD8IB48_9APIA|nr:hypothetical protein POM88_020000 [Heracleum sosnowskyi]
MDWVRRKIGFDGMIVAEPQGRNGGLPFLWKEMDHENLIDRALTTASWLEMFPMGKLYNLEGSTSDNNPLLLVPVVQIQAATTRSFRFENAWLTDPMCEQLVRNGWERNSGSNIQEKIQNCGGEVGSVGKGSNGYASQESNNIIKGETWKQRLRGMKPGPTTPIDHHNVPYIVNIVWIQLMASSQTTYPSKEKASFIEVILMETAEINLGFSMKHMGRFMELEIKLNSREEKTLIEKRKALQ